MPLAGGRCLLFCTALGGLADRNLYNPSSVCFILTALVLLMDNSIVDHWFLSWFRNMHRRRIVAAMSFIFRAGMGTLRRPSSPQQQYLWPFSLFFDAYDGVGRISGHCGGLYRVYLVK